MVVAGPGEKLGNVPSVLRFPLPEPSVHPPTGTIGTAISSNLWRPRRRWCRPAQVAMHLRVRPLQVLIKLLFLGVAQELAELFVGFIAVRPHLVQALFTRQTFVLHDLLRGIMQFLEDWCDSGLLIAGEIKLLGQNFQLLL